MFRSFAALAGALALSLGFAASWSNAETVTFRNFVNQDGSDTAKDWIDFVVTVHDELPGKFTITVDQTATSPNLGDITGVYFDAYEGLTKANAGITKIVGDIEAIYADTNHLPGGSGINPIPPFDLGIQYYGMTRKVGKTTYRDDLQSVSFTMNNLDGIINLEDFARFGVRAQSVGPNGVDRLTYNLQGSTKEYSTFNTPPNVVPLPAAVWGGMALMGLLGVKRACCRNGAA